MLDQKTRLQLFEKHCSKTHRLLDSSSTIIKDLLNIVESYKYRRNGVLDYHEQKTVEEAQRYLSELNLLKKPIVK